MLRQKLRPTPKGDFILISFLCIKLNSECSSSAQESAEQKYLSENADKVQLHPLVLNDLIPRCSVTPLDQLRLIIFLEQS